MKSETLDYVLDSVMGIMESLMLEKHYDLFEAQHPGLDWDQLDLEATVHKFCHNKSMKEFMIESIVDFIKENKLEN